MFKLIVASVGLLLVLLLGSAQPAFAHIVDDNGSGECTTPGHEREQPVRSNEDEAADKNGNSIVCKHPLGGAPTAVVTVNGDGTLRVNGMENGMASALCQARIDGSGSVDGECKIENETGFVELDCGLNDDCTGESQSACHCTLTKCECTNSASIIGTCNLSNGTHESCSWLLDEGTNRITCLVGARFSLELALTRGMINVQRLPEILAPPFPPSPTEPKPKVP